MELIPDPAAMRIQLKTMFEHATEGLIEISHEHAPSKGLTGKKRFGLDEIDAAVAYAADVNGRGLNTYVGWGLRREDMKASDKSTSADCISIPTVAWDFDRLEDSVRGLEIAEKLGLRFDLIVQTGALRNHGAVDLRVQTWLQMKAPLTDLGEAEALIKRGTEVFGSDPSITDARRVMRMAGSIAWARKDGRTDEATSIRFDLMM
jgi:hypothetical protein